jgi:hypothetical protein
VPLPLCLHAARCLGRQRKCCLVALPTARVHSTLHHPCQKGAETAREPKSEQGQFRIECSSPHEQKQEVMLAAKWERVGWEP